MTEQQEKAMRYLREHKRHWSSAIDIGVKPAVMASLVRKGLVRSVKQTVNPIHEPQYSYQLYTLPEPGWA